MFMRFDCFATFTFLCSNDKVKCLYADDNYLISNKFISQANVFLLFCFLAEIFSESVEIGVKFSKQKNIKPVHKSRGESEKVLIASLLIYT